VRGWAMEIGGGREDGEMNWRKVELSRALDDRVRRGDEW